GGYVKMAGENPGEERRGAADEFPSKPMGVRIFIISAGVIMNVIAAALFYFVAFAGHVDQPPAVAGAVSPGGAAWSAGIQPGDRILAVDGDRVRSFLELRMKTVFLDPGKRAVLDIERGPERLQAPVVPRYEEETGAVLLRIQPGANLEIAQGEKRVEIGASVTVRVAGIPTRGGRAASGLVSRALGALGPDEALVIEVDDAPPVTFRFGLEPPPTPAGKTASFRIGIEAYGHPRIAAVRGTAVGRIRVDDRLVGAVDARGTVAVEGLEDASLLAFHPPLESLLVERDGNEVVVPVGAADRASAYAFLGNLALEIERGTVVKPLPAGRTGTTPTGLARYPRAPCLEAGIEAGDTVLSIGGQAVASWGDILAAVGRIHTTEPIRLRIRSPERGEREVEVRPVALVPLEGITLTAAEEPFETDGWADAGRVALARTGREITNVFRLIGAFFTGRISFQKNVAGPATIVAISSSAAQSSFLTLLLFLAYISVTLAVLNILPIPVLDGGHLLFILIEKIKGSPLKDETIGKLQFVGMMLLLLLMFFAFRNDFNNLVP
ncbi:MAG: site-2 protease family protein, partial [Planctomycetota bacterium]